MMMKKKAVRGQMEGCMFFGLIAGSDYDEPQVIL